MRRSICFQELFYGPYFCQVQDAAYYDYAEAVPEGPTTQRFMALAAELNMVMILPVYEMEQEGVLYNTAAVIDADGTYLGKYRKNHIPQVSGFWEKFYFRPATSATRSSTPRSGESVSTSVTTDTSPKGGAPSVSTAPRSSSTRRRQPGLSAYLWQLEQPASAVANEYFVGAINRVGVEDLGTTTSTVSSYFVSPRGQFVGDVASTSDDDWSCATSTWTY